MSVNCSINLLIDESHIYPKRNNRNNVKKKIVSRVFWRILKRVKCIFAIFADNLINTCKNRKKKSCIGD
jgi:hypothetical protein